MGIFVRLFVVALVFAAAGANATTRRWIVTTADGKQAGQQVTDCNATGACRASFIFKDNGRGPEIKESFQIAADGTMAKYVATGTTTYGSIVDEQFSRSGKSAEWRSTTEKGSSKDALGKLYLPMNGTAVQYDRLLQLTATRTDPLPVLPAGSVSRRILRTLTVGTAATQQQVDLVAFSGLGMTPDFVWATHGPNPEFFGQIVPGAIYILPEQFQSVRVQFEQTQVAAEAELLQTMRARLSTSMAGVSVIRNARVFDSEHAKLLDGLRDVYVLRGRIAAVQPAGTGSPDVDIVRTLDADGRVLLPGLFDMHGHVSRWEGGLNLAAGVTTSRDMGGDNKTLQLMLDETADGRLFGPQLVLCGFLEGESSYSARNGFVISTLEQAKAAIDWYAAHAYPQIKIYNSFPRQHLHETVAYAHLRGLRVSGHVPAFLRAQDVVDAGFDEIQHINQVMLNFLVDDKTDTRTLQRFYLPAEKTAAINFDGPKAQAFIRSLVDRGVNIDPTLTTFDFLRQRDGEMSQAYAAIVTHLPALAQRRFLSGGMNIPNKAKHDLYNRSYAHMIEFVGRLHRAGVPLVAGTDEIAGFTLQRELETYVMAGIPPAEVLRIATWNGAKYSRVLQDRGSISPGKLADLVLIDGDPTKDITVIRRVALVVTQGRSIDPSIVYRELGIDPFVGAMPVWKSTATNQ